MTNTGRTSNFIVTATRGAKLKTNNVKNLMTHFKQGRITKGEFLGRVNALAGQVKATNGFCSFCFNLGLGGTSCAHAV